MYDPDFVTLVSAENRTHFRLNFKMALDADKRRYSLIEQDIQAERASPQR